jgi:hypothetical protein
MLLATTDATLLKAVRNVLKTTTNRLDRTNHQQKTKLKLKSKKTIES